MATSKMLPLNQGDIRYVTLWIPLILGVKVLHIAMCPATQWLCVAGSFLVYKYSRDKCLIGVEGHEAAQALSKQAALQYC